MISPRVVKGFHEEGNIHVYVFSSLALGAVAVAYGVAGIKTDNLFVAGLVTITVYYVITGSGVTTLRAIPMDDSDQVEMPIQVVLGSGIASGAGFVNVAISMVCTSLKLQVISTSNNTITALIFGRTA